MIKYQHIYIVFLIPVFCASCGQNKTNLPKEKVKSETKDTVTSYWHDNDTAVQIRNGSKGTILIASLGGVVFRYDGKSFTNLTSKLGARKFHDALEDRNGNLWLDSVIQVFIITMGNPFNILQPGRGLLIIGLSLFMKIKPALFGSAQEAE